MKGGLERRKIDREGLRIGSGDTWSVLELERDGMRFGIYEGRVDRDGAVRRVAKWAESVQGSESKGTVS